MAPPLAAARSVLFLGALRNLFGGGGPRIESVDAREAHRLQADEGAVILDVREAHEWRSGHAPRARHIPLGELDRRHRQLPRDKTIVVACASGMRSRRAAKQLLAAGFPKVLNLSGGMGAWRGSGLPFER